MASSERDHRLAFLGLTAQDEELLKALRPLFEQHLAAIEEAFYEHLQRFPETFRLLRDHTTVERLKELQRAYLLRLTAGNFDEAYCAERLAIGRAHERVGLSPRWYLLAYSRYFQLFTPLIREFYRAEPRRADVSILALEKAFMLDASLALDAYIASDRYRHLQQLQSIVNDSADAIFLLDPEMRVQGWNRAAERIFGWTAVEITGQHVAMLVPPELVRAGELQQIDATIRQSGHCQLETVRLAKDGRRVEVDLSASVLRDPQGEAIGRSAILRDITGRKRLEEAKLQSERLATIGAMSAKLAHEIRNPLTSITLNIELIRDELAVLSKNNAAAGVEAHALLQSIDAEVRRIQRVTEDYLQFARLPKMQRETVSLNELLTQGLSFLQSLFDASKVKMQTEFDSALPPIQADEGQLWQAILNLIRNALEAMPQGGTLTVRTARAAGGVALSIRDTGKGIGPEERPRLFKPFFSTKVGGTGLGLPLTQQIIIEHGGSIECASAPGQGTTFTIQLPPLTES